MTDELKRKIERAIRLIQSAEQMAIEHGQPLEIAYSGGKDSDVILELTRMANVSYIAIYKNTTIDPPYTIKHALDNGAQIMRPKQTFYQLIQKHGFPSLFKRFCCGKLKEYKVLDYAVLGIRRAESKKRSKQYQEPEICKMYSKTQKVRQYYPILDWSNDDVAEFIKEREIQCHPLYYDENGVFHPERRLGCIGCPLIYKTKRIAQFKQHPGMVKLYIRGGGKYWETHPNTKVKEYFRDVYEQFTMSLYCQTLDEFRMKFIENDVSCKKFLEEEFGIEL